MFQLQVDTFDDFLTESKHIMPTTKNCLLFTDIKGSSLLWKSSESKMYKAIIQHEDQIFRLCDKYDGVVLKSIGDSFMISFDDLINGIKFIIDLQIELKTKPIKVGKESIKIRAGMCYGEVYERTSERQGKNLVDYFGNVVNTASRMESKVSEVGGFAFAYQSKQSKDEKNEIVELLEKENINFKVIDYTDEKNVDEDRIRSGRLLSDTHKFVIRALKKLKGVDDVIVYKCEI